jgi:hypothetical protein
MFTLYSRVEKWVNNDGLFRQPESRWGRTTFTVTVIYERRGGLL